MSISNLNSGPQFGISTNPAHGKGKPAASEAKPTDSQFKGLLHTGSAGDKFTSSNDLFTQQSSPADDKTQDPEDKDKASSTSEDKKKLDKDPAVQKEKDKELKKAKKESEQLEKTDKKAQEQAKKDQEAAQKAKENLDGKKGVDLFKAGLAYHKAQKRAEHSMSKAEKASQDLSDSADTINFLSAPPTEDVPADAGASAPAATPAGNEAASTPTTLTDTPKTPSEKPPSTGPVFKITSAPTPTPQPDAGQPKQTPPLPPGLNPPNLNQSVLPPELLGALNTAISPPPTQPGDQTPPPTKDQGESPEAQPKPDGKKAKPGSNSDPNWTKGLISGIIDQYFGGKPPVDGTREISGLQFTRG